jgi:signal transduction histidine kinase
MDGGNVNRIALGLPARVILAQLVVGVALFVTLTTFGPEMLLLDPKVTVSAVRTAFWTAGPVGMITYVLTRIRLSRHKYVLRAMARGSQLLEAEDIVGLSSLPAHATAVFLGVVSTAIVAVMLTPLRPQLLDFDTALSLSLLGISIAVTAALLLYVFVRASISRVLETVNPDAVSDLLAQVEITRLARTRLVRRVLVATAAPVGFVAFGAALIAHAHVRRFDQESRERTAEAICRVALESSVGAVPDAGREEALAAAARLGFAAHIDHKVGRFSLNRQNDGRMELIAPLEDGSAVVRFRDSDISPIAFADVGIALLGLLLSAVLGTTLGRWLADDLAIATRRVRMLRTDRVALRPESAPYSTATFASVAMLNQAINTLAERFRVFADAQKRAIVARKAAHRVRSLLFASVSHDLRSPLNAILGFAGLIRQKALSPPQRESLRFIEQSGRELLFLIETILDSAKVEAGRVALMRSVTSVAAVVADSIRSVRQTAGGRPFDVEVEIDEGLPRLWVDEPRIVQALASLLWFSARMGDASLSNDNVRAFVRARSVSDRTIGLDLNVFGCTISAEELEALLSAEPGLVDRRKYGALALALGLSQSLLGLHGGSLHVRQADSWNARFEIQLPTAPGPDP